MYITYILSLSSFKMYGQKKKKNSQNWSIWVLSDPLQVVFVCVCVCVSLTKCLKYTSLLELSS